MQRSRNGGTNDPWHAPPTIKTALWQGGPTDSGPRVDRPAQRTAAKPLAGHPRGTRRARSARSRGARRHRVRHQPTIPAGVRIAIDDACSRPPSGRTPHGRRRVVHGRAGCTFAISEQLRGRTGLRRRCHRAPSALDACREIGSRNRAGTSVAAIAVIRRAGAAQQIRHSGMSHHRWPPARHFRADASACGGGDAGSRI